MKPLNLMVRAPENKGLKIRVDDPELIGHTFLIEVIIEDVHPGSCSHAASRAFIIKVKCGGFCIKDCNTLDDIAWVEQTYDCHDYLILPKYTLNTDVTISYVINFDEVGNL